MTLSAFTMHYRNKLIIIVHIFPGFKGKMSTLTHFSLGLDCNDYSFLDQAVVDLEQGLDSILIDSINTSHLDASLD